MNWRSLDEVYKLYPLPFTLAPLQEQDVRDLGAMQRIAFFYAVGAGKTVCSTLVALMWNQPHNLVIVPPILIDDWANWLTSIKVQGVEIYRGPQRKTETLQSPWVVMSHAIFRDDYQKITFALRGADASVLIDEAQHIKSSSSKLFRYVNGFAANRNICLMTATPTTKPVDSYSYIKLKTPQVYRSLSHFENLHVAERDIFKSVTKWRQLEEVASALALQAVRRDKREMFGHNLDPINMPIKYKLSSSHYRLYQQLMDEQLLLFTDGTKIDATTAQRLYHASQQIILNYDYFSGKDGNRSAAYDLLDQVIEEVNPMDHGSSKLVVWTYYQRSSAAVTQYLKAAYGDSVVAAYGAVDSGKAVKAIMHDDRVRILVAQPSSVGVGLNLHHVCSEMLFLEMATSPMQIRQAMGRVDRVGQTVRPTIRFALAERTVQNKLFNRLLDNDELVQQVEKTPKSLRQEIFGL